VDRGEVLVLVIDDWESSIEGLKDWAGFECLRGFIFLLAGTQVIIETDKLKGTSTTRATAKEDR